MNNFFTFVLNRFVATKQIKKEKQTKKPIKIFTFVHKNKTNVLEKKIHWQKRNVYSEI